MRRVRGATPVIAVNGRFVTQPVTGVQRYAHEIVSRLAGVTGWTIRLIVPPDRIVDLGPGDATSQDLDEAWWGGRGHLWEQTRLPLLCRRAGADLLLSPCGWGPLTQRSQLVVLHDLHPITHPEYFVPSFVRLTKVATPFLTHVPRRVGVTSKTVEDQVVGHLLVDPRRVDTVPPAVGPPFTDAALGDLAARPGDYCLFVQGDKAQKNLDFVLSFWPEVHERFGLELVVTERPVESRVAGHTDDPPGVRRVESPSDDELVRLYTGALCLLWPSLAEGFGIPLLEAMALGTPFLSSDVGAARELAVEPTQVLPLTADAWVDQLGRWREGGLGDLRARCATRGREATWERSTQAMAAAIARSLD